MFYGSSSTKLKLIQLGISIVLVHSLKTKIGIKMQNLGHINKKMVTLIDGEDRTVEIMYPKSGLKVLFQTTC